MTIRTSAENPRALKGLMWTFCVAAAFLALIAPTFVSAHEEIPGAGAVTFTRVLEGKKGKYRIDLTHSPSLPTAGEIANIDFKVVRLLPTPDPLLGSEAPLTQPPDASLVFSDSQKVLDAHMPVAQEGGAGEYGVAEYKFPRGGSFFLRMVIHGESGDDVTTDFPITVKSDESGLFRLWMNLGMGLFIIGITAMQVSRARSKGGETAQILRPALIGLVALVVVVFVMDRFVLGPVLDLRKPKLPPATPGTVTVNEEGGYVIPASAQKELGITIVEAKEMPLEQAVSAVGKVESRPDLTAVIQAPLWGRIEWAFPDKPIAVGDAVRKNQVLVNVVLELSALERGPMDAKNLDIKGVLQHAKERKETTQLEYERWQKLAAANSAYEQDVKWAKELRDQAAIDYDQINQQDKQFSGPGGTMQFRDPRKTAVPSPINGTIASVDFIPGDLVAVDDFKKLFTVVDTSKVWVRAEVYLADAWKLRRDQPVRVIPASSSAKPVIGTIHWIGGTLNAASRTVPVLIDVANEGQVFGLGSFARLEFEQKQKVLAVPQEAVVDTGTDRWVYLEGENQTFSAVAVQVGATKDGWSQIVSGLQPGDRVIGKGAALLGSMPHEEAAEVPEVSPAPSAATASPANTSLASDGKIADESKTGEKAAAENRSVAVQASATRD